MKPATTLELVAFYPKALAMATPWLVSGLISTESELIDLTLKYHQELTANEETQTDKTRARDKKLGYRSSS